tara:strand:- start:160 stop:669 length:510 start_codon:yes stop_codon:yes gene_type:complete
MIKIIRNLLSSKECVDMSKEMFDLDAKGMTNEHRVINCAAVYNPPQTHSAMYKYKFQIQDAVGKKLHGTYSYGRLYRHGNILEKHTDREASEYGVSVTTGIGGDYQWPFYIDGTEVNLEIGDAVIYKGTELEHWREENKNNWYTVSLFFFVDADGEYKHLKDDEERNIV